MWAPAPALAPTPEPASEPAPRALYQVRYSCHSFLEKNNDSLDASFKEMLLASSNEGVKALAQSADERQQAASESAQPGITKTKDRGPAAAPRSRGPRATIAAAPGPRYR